MDCVKFFCYLAVSQLFICSIACLVMGSIGMSTMDIVDGNGVHIGMITISAVVLLIGVLGLVGLVRQSPRLMWVFVGFSICGMIVALGFKYAISHSDFEDDVRHAVGEIWKKETLKEGSMDKIQETYLCCGLDSVKDYELMGRLPPKTCDGPDNIKSTGCLDSVSKHLSLKYQIRTIIVKGTATSFISPILFGIWMAIRLKTLKERVNY